jgi:hypothetical protein
MIVTGLQSANMCATWLQTYDIMFMKQTDLIFMDVREPDVWRKWCHKSEQDKDNKLRERERERLRSNHN